MITEGLSRTLWILVGAALGFGDSFISNNSGCPDHFSCVPVKDCPARHQTDGSNMEKHSPIFFVCDSPTPGQQGVCCPLAEIMNRMSLLPTEECGPTTSDRIFGGTNAHLGQFPWMALLGYTVLNSNKEEFPCGGTLISERYVLTAAHCLKDERRMPKFIRLGEHILNKTDDCTCFGSFNTSECLPADLYCTQQVIDILIEEAIPHEHYMNLTAKNDIALLRLKSKVKYTDFVQPICLPFNVTITGEEEANYTVAGWGRTDHNSPPSSDILQVVSVRSTPLEDCSPLYNDQLDDSQLCAGNDGKDACHGDSGGPMSHHYAVPSDMPPRVFQIGIVSYGAGSRCGAVTAPTVYTRVTAYLNWILRNIRE